MTSLLVVIRTKWSSAQRKTPCNHHGPRHEKTPEARRLRGLEENGGNRFMIRACYLPASSTSSSVRSPVFGACTSTDMLPGLCSLRYSFMCASGSSAQVHTSAMPGSRRRSTLHWLAAPRFFHAANGATVRLVDRTHG